MKKLPIQIVLAIACAVTLNACSSGGSSAPSALSAPQDKAAAEKAAAEKAAAEKAAAEKAAAEKAAAEKAAAEKAAAEKAAAEKAAAEKAAAEKAAAEKAAAEKAAAEKAAAEKAAAEKAAAEKATAEKAAAEKAAAEKAAAEKAAAEKAAAEKAAAEKAAAEKAAAEKAAEKAAAEKAAAEKPTEAAGSFTEALSKGFVANNTSKKDWMARTPTNGLIVTIDNNAGGAVTGQLPQTESFDVLTLNGTKILLFARVQDKFKEIAMRPLSAPDFPNKDFKGEGLVGSIGDSYKDVFQNVRYGVYTVDGKSHLFVQGNPSPWLPGAKYSYEGSAVYGKDGKYSRAQSSAIVDFANKTIDVTITPPSITGHADRSPLKFGGEIKGNTFSGTKNGIETRGGFFGSGGVDLGGIYHAHQGEHQGYNGAYGASNQQRIQ